jgi:hypothetical protein
MPTPGTVFVVVIAVVVVINVADVYMFDSVIGAVYLYTLYCVAPTLEVQDSDTLVLVDGDTVPIVNTGASGGNIIALFSMFMFAENKMAVADTIVQSKMAGKTSARLF